MKTRFIFVCVFCWGLGLAGLIPSIYTFATGTNFYGNNMLFDSPNFILKYSIPLIFSAFSIPILSFPFLVYKGLLTMDYYNASPPQKALNNIVIGTLSLPAYGIIFVMYFYDDWDNSKIQFKILLLLLFFSSYYLGSIIYLIWAREEKKKRPHNQAAQKGQPGHSVSEHLGEQNNNRH